MGDVMHFLRIAVLLIAWAGGAAADTRGINIQVKDNVGTTVALYAESHALVVGISEYTNGWPRLRGVGEDVPAVKAALERQGFAVTVVMDPDRQQIDDAFRDFISRHGQRPDNRLLFYFAGHGHSMKLGYGGMMGYGRDLGAIIHVSGANRALSHVVGIGHLGVSPYFRWSHLARICGLALSADAALCASSEHALLTGRCEGTAGDPVGEIAGGITDGAPR